MVFRRGGTAPASAKKQCALSISFVPATPYRQSGVCSVVTFDVTKRIGVCPLAPVLLSVGLNIPSRSQKFYPVGRFHSSTPQRDRTSRSTADRKGTGRGPPQRETRMFIRRFWMRGNDRQTIVFAVHLATKRTTSRQKSPLNRRK